MQLDDLCEPRLELQQALERLIQRDDIDGEFRRRQCRFSADRSRMPALRLTRERDFA